jgi:hypothetical protein
METKVKKTKIQKNHIDSSLSKFKEKDFFPKKTTKFNEMIARIGEDKFTQLVGSKKQN